MRTPIKNVLYLLSAIPLLLKVPYLIASWCDSIFERYDIYIWLMIPFVAFTSELVRRRARISGDRKIYKKIFLLVIVVSVLGYFSLENIFNAIGFTLAVAILFVATGLRFGEKVFLAQIPTLLFALSTIPNLSFWANYSLDLGATTILSFFLSKLLLCFVFFLLWGIHALYLKRYPNFFSTIFCGLVVLSILYSTTHARDISSGDSLLINPKTLSVGEWIGMDVPKTESDKRLFSNTDKVDRKIYYNDISYISLLTISSADKSKMHPAEICIKSTGAPVESSRQIYLNVGGKKIQANEIIFSINGNKFAEYSIFSDGKISTGYFTKFRLRSDNARWVHYQISTPLSSTEEQIRARIEKFLEKLSN